MEEVSSRRSSNDEYGSFSSSLMEPTAMHDVMSLEMSHSMADNYLDPRSFGDGASFDEFGGQVESRFDSDNGHEQPVQLRSHYSSHQQGQPLPPPGSRFDHHATHGPVRTAVPTYPVKTVDPNTSTQFAPARIIKPPRIRHSGSRSSQKKEPMDPKTVEDEVARNVSQILSATKQQKLAQEAQQRCGIVAPVSRINFSCSDCGKTMTSHRNLQRHRQTSCCRKVGEWVDRSQSWPDQWNEKDPMSEDSDSLPGIGAHSLPHSSFSSESSGWCSPNNPYSPSAMGSVDMGNMLPLSLDTDDSHTHSSSASHCSNSSTGKAGSESFMCDACKKTVCSLRSLKRHHTTCKQYITEFGPPQDGADTSSIVPVKQRSSARRVKTPNYTEDSRSSSSGGSSPARQDYELLLPRRVPADSTQNDDRPQKQILAANTCADCNRQLCSASNLKRHRATCKMALTKGEVPQTSPAPPPPPASTSNLPELPPKERNIIDRSYAAAVAASEHVRMQARAAQQGSETPPPMVERPRPQQQYTAYIVTSPRTNQKPQPYITVGEHLRAKHVQQKLFEPTDEPQGAVLIQNAPPPNAPAHNQIVQIRRPSLAEMPPPSHPVRLDHSRPTHVTVIKSDSTEIPPLESIITTQPLSGDRVTGVPVLVHDSRQQGLANKVPVAQTAEFQCPECKKTYSCRKNVKRHRMAVHKITSEDISRWPGPAPCPHAHIGETSQLSPSLPRILLPPRVDPKAEFKTETIALSPTVMDKGFSQDAQTWQHDFEDSNKEVGLKRRSSEMNELDEKKSRPELAEADSTFNEDKEFGSNSHHSSPGIVSSSGPLPSLASWMSSRPLSVDIPYGGTRSAGHSPLFKSRRFDVDVPSSFFSHEDGLPLDPMLGHGPSSASRELDEDAWYKQEEMPDSTTCQRLDRSTSPGILMESDPPPLGTLPYTRKRAMSGGSSSSPAFSNDPKQIRHQCQDCGKFYSSEWNLERHRRESCPTKIMPPEETAPVLQGDEISILIGSCRFVLPRSALIKASTAFTSLFQIHDPAKGELRLEGDPMDFQNLLDVYNDPVNLTRANVDSVLALAEQYKFVQVTDTCAKFICDELSKLSLMHAIRLADQHKLLAVKIRLFSSISIEVFRALNSDRDYQMMSSELKAELLEKWGTFL